MAQDATGVYTGLKWRDGRGARPILVGPSAITPVHYLVDMSRAPEAFTLMMAFVQAGEKTADRKGAGLAQAEMGRFDSVEAAMHAAEKHDFEFFRRDLLTEDRIARFAGSPRVSKWLDSRDDVEDDNSVTGADDDDRLSMFLESGASYFTGTKTAAKQNNDGSKTFTLKIDAAEVPLWLDRAPMGQLLLLAAIDAGHGLDPHDTDYAKRTRDAIKKAQVLPQEAAFQQWISRYDWWGLIETAQQFNSDTLEHAVGDTLKRIVGVASRSELKTNRDALEKFEALIREYYRDMSLDFASAKRKGRAGDRAGKPETADQTQRNAS